MSMLLFIIGGIAVMAGAVCIAFGIPINEFSFGNTLIISGTTIGAGGLIVIALAAVIGQLQRIAEAMSARPAAAPHEAYEPPSPEARPGLAPARIPFPPKTRPAEPGMREPHGFQPPLHTEAGEEEQPSFAPSLRNPEAPPVTVEEEVSLSPQPAAGAPSPADFAEPPAGEPAFEPPWRSAPPREPPAGNFDAMWPARPPAAAEPLPEPEPEPPLAPPEMEPASPPRVAVLKSGVVDGMGYTLYVDGSIEAELPQGTLRFASIDELRAHLEKGS